jgi:type VI secretion system secreted protein Hcp
MTMTAFLKLTGDKVGDVKGSARQKGREFLISVIGFDHIVHAERYGDADPLGKTGMPTSKRRHGALVVTKEIDRATPKLHQAHAQNDVFKTFSLHCWRVPPAGGGPKGIAEENHWTIHLANARIAAIRTVMKNVRLPANSALPEMEEVEFTYDAIDYYWEALKGGDGSVVKQTCPAIDGDFTKANADMVTWQIVAGAVGDVSKAIGKQVGDFLKVDAKQMFLDALKEK